MYIRTLVVALTCVVTLSAQTVRIDGTWTGQAVGQAGVFPVTFVFEMKGAEVTGYMIQDGTKAPLRDLVLDGDWLSFWVGPGEEVSLSLEGVVSNSEIRLKAVADIGATFDLVLTRHRESEAP